MNSSARAGENIGTGKKCPACGSLMDNVSSWESHCASCNFRSSTLVSGGAPLGDGFEDLRRANFRRILDRMAEHHALAGATMLEVGCGRGWFLEACHQEGMHISGIEPGPDGQVPRDKGFNVDSGFFPDDLKSPGPFDFIVFNDVFEHIPEPIAAIKAVEDNLAVGGIVVLNLPSSTGFFFRLARVLNTFKISGPYDRMWQKGLTSPHMSYFNVDNLVRFTEKHTNLESVSVSTLPSIARQGLRDRIKITVPGLLGDAVFGTVWLGSFLLPILAKDAIVLMFKRVT